MIHSIDFRPSECLHRTQTCDLHLKMGQQLKSLNFPISRPLPKEVGSFFKKTQMEADREHRSQENNLFFIYVCFLVPVDIQHSASFR